MPKSNRCFSNLTSTFAATGHPSGIDADLDIHRRASRQTTTSRNATEVRIPTPTPTSMDPRPAPPSEPRRCRAGPRRTPPLPCARRPASLPHLGVPAAAVRVVLPARRRGLLQVAALGVIAGRGCQYIVPLSISVLSERVRCRLSVVSWAYDVIINNSSFHLSFVALRPPHARQRQSVRAC